MLHTLYSKNKLKGKIAKKIRFYLKDPQAEHLLKTYALHLFVFGQYITKKHGDKKCKNITLVLQQHSDMTA